MTYLRVRASILWLALAALGAPPTAAGPMLWQTNSSGDDIHVFDLVVSYELYDVPWGRGVDPERAVRHRSLRR